jgi:hypothetical protein
MISVLTGTGHVTSLLLVSHTNRFALLVRTEPVAGTTAAAVGELCAASDALFVVVLHEVALARSLLSRHVTNICTPNDQYRYRTNNNKVPCPLNLPHCLSHCSSLLKRLPFPPQPVYVNGVHT